MLGLGADAVGQAVEFALQPGFEGGAPVVDEHAHLGQDLGHSFDADVQGPDGGEQLGVANDVASGVLGQYDGQGPPDVVVHASAPAVGLSELVGDIDRPPQPGVTGVGVGGGVEAGEVAACLEQSELDPADRRAPRGFRGWLARRASPIVDAGRGRRGASVVDHAGEEQLVEGADLVQETRGDGSSARRAGRVSFGPGLVPAQAAVTVAQQGRPAAPGAGLLVTAVLVAP
ncbi:hypothetical protein [Nonomuraea sp. NPDC049607]|uniref:hypothetical protein n=1 Tax=Nonomuraea sp. NPDC049607 TaxID=3154732 RepID=UPI003429FAD4